MKKKYNNIIKFNQALFFGLITLLLCTASVYGQSKLSGTVIGTTGSFNNIGNTRDKVFDNDVNSFFDAPQAEAWAGLDLGSGHTVTSIRYYPRSNFPDRMVGGKFQGSNSENFSSGVTDLHTITSQPAVAWTNVNISNNGSFRYVRYLGPPNGFGNVSEVEFHGTSGSTGGGNQTSGYVVREVWNNITGTSVSNIPLNTAPSSTNNLNSLEGPTNVADNYGTRIRGYIVPATSGSYRFYVASDDNSELWLSTNDSPGNKQKIAEVVGWTNPREWNKYPSQQSALRSLTAGTRYYFEVLHKEGTGGDNLAVGWTGPGISNITVIGSSFISHFEQSAVSGYVVREVWNNITGTNVSNIPLNTAPSSTNNLNSLEGPTNVADNYGTRIRGYVVPATSGSYRFYVASDDHSELLLSTNDSPGNKQKIAEVVGWTNPREWNKYPSQQSALRSLTAGTRYYFEVLHKEGTGGDNLAVGWTGPGISNITVIGSSFISHFEGGPPPPPPSGNGIPLSVNKNSKRQTMDGFGFFGARDVWWGSSNASHFHSNAWLDLIVQDLGVSIWRNELYPHNPVHLNNTPNQDAHWDKQRPMVQALKAKADALGVDMKFILTVWTPPGGFKWWSQMAWAGDQNALRGPSSSGDYYSEKNGGTLNPNKYNDFANWLSAGIQMYKNAGVNIFALSPQNEPLFSQPYNSCTYTTHWYADMIKAVIPQVKSQHPGVKIFGAEHMLINEGRESDIPWFYHTRLKNDPTAINHIDALAVHGYLDGVNAGSGSELATYWNNHRTNFTQPLNKSAWMTETSGYVHSWEASNGKPGALGLANDIQSALLHGDVSGWVYWQGSALNGLGEFNLMSDLTVGKNYYASKHFYRFIRPGAVRLATSSPDNDISISAFEHIQNGTMTYVIINSSSSSKDIVLSTTGSGFPSQYEMFVSSATLNCQSQGMKAANSTITLPARSIVTLQAGGMPLGGSGSSIASVSSSSVNYTAGLKQANEDILMPLTIYPNPTTDKLSILSGSEKIKRASISTILGDNLNLVPMYHKGEIEFDLKDQPAGIYILTVEKDDGKKTYRIIKK